MNPGPIRSTLSALLGLFALFVGVKALATPDADPGEEIPFAVFLVALGLLNLAAGTVGRMSSRFRRAVLVLNTLTMGSIVILLSQASIG